MLALLPIWWRRSARVKLEVMFEVAELAQTSFAVYLAEDDLGIFG